MDKKSYFFRYVNDSERWKQFIQSRGRSFIFSTSTTIPNAAAAHGTEEYSFKNDLG